MAGLVDIAPLADEVEIRGTSVTVTGLSARGLAMLMAEFPALRKWIDGVSIGFEEIAGTAGDAVAKILAAGTGLPGDADAIAAADRLTVGDQARLFAAIVRITAPEGVGPLAREVAAALGVDLDAALAALSADEADPSETGDRTSSPKPSSD